MRLSNRQLSAFMAVAATLNFTRAAERLNITQSALSQRIRQLEIEIGSTLLNRSSRGVEITEVGSRVLRFCRASFSLEEEILSDLASDPDGPLKGAIRIAAHSSILQPVLIPTLASLLRENPLVQCELINAEAKDLPGILKRGEAEFVIMDTCLDWNNLSVEKLGQEIYVAICSTEHESRKEVYLDLNALDRVTEDFFSQQDNPPEYQRSFLSDVFGIISGVQNGLGRAVVSQHLLRENTSVRVLSEFRSIPSPIALHFFKQNYYTRLHTAVLDILRNECPKYLA